MQSYYHTSDAQGVRWDFVEVIASGAPTLTPASDGAGAGGGCSAQDPGACAPCHDGGTCGWVQEVFLKPERAGGANRARALPRSAAANLRVD